jgi:hypothetical protein
MSDKVQLIYNKIENRIDEICDDGFVLKENQQEYETLTDLEDFIDFLPEESVSEDLEEHYTKEFLPKEWFAKPGHRTISEFNLFTAQYFAKCQKNQMMKDAVKANVFVDYNRNFGYGTIAADVDLDEYKLKEGDKVKIIIIKEE